MNLTEIKSRFEGLKRRAEGMKEKADHVLKQGLAAVEVTAVAGAIGVAEGWNGGDITLGSVPVEWVGAAALHGYAFLSGSAQADHFHNLGNGALAVGGYKSGLALGKKAKSNKDTKGSIFGEDDTPALPGQSRVQHGEAMPRERTTALQRCLTPVRG